MPKVLSGWDVVVVDDEADYQHMHRLLLQAYGATVHVAKDGREGLKLTHQVKPQFVLSDLDLPVMNGWEMMQMLKGNAATADIPVFAVTASNFAGDRERALRVGFYKFLLKPLNAQKVRAQVIDSLLELPALRAELMARLAAAAYAAVTK
jgi:CheY-like chemotaxis protein